ncbi:MAG: hypothetical protein DHS80DRAFT_13131 [Piptocephalis tieghemiana]|nr:MAG: hypothetical protein DHS80DRAFT_13131 [Piptocephalis tieghemiana]
MNDETREFIYRLTDITRRVLHFGFIPFVIYMGMTRSSPRPSLLRLISPLP